MSPLDAVIAQSHSAFNNKHYYQCCE